MDPVESTGDQRLRKKERPTRDIMN
jgi:hypothetical protein